MARWTSSAGHFYMYLWHGFAFASFMDMETAIGITASVGTGTSLLPQLVKIVKEKKADDISFGMLGVLLVGLCFWVTYGFMKEDVIIIVSNGFSAIINIIITILAIRYRSHKN